MIALVLRYWYFGVIALLVLALGTQQVRIEHVKTQNATLKQTAAELLADREKVARQHAQHINQLQVKHAEDQYALEKEHAKKLTDIETRRRNAVAESERLRGAIHAYAASGSLRGGDVDSAAAERAADRLEKLATLLTEGTGLLIEGRGLVEQRDAEVSRLLEQIVLDRRTCSAK